LSGCTIRMPSRRCPRPFVDKLTEALTLSASVFYIDAKYTTTGCGSVKTWKGTTCTGASPTNAGVTVTGAPIVSNGECLLSAPWSFAVAVEYHSGRCLLRAGLAVIGAEALRLRRRFAHVLALLGLAVPAITRTVVDLRRCIDPHEARTSAYRDRRWR